MRAHTIRNKPNKNCFEDAIGVPGPTAARYSKAVAVK
jgi:hypothetical protein